MEIPVFGSEEYKAKFEASRAKFASAVKELKQERRTIIVIKKLPKWTIYQFVSWTGA